MASANTPLAAFLPYVLPNVPACPEPVAEFQLRLAAIEFCERTRCWRHIITTSISANNQTLVAPSYSTIHLFEEATFNSRPLRPTQYTQADPADLTGAANNGSPAYITQLEPGVVAIYPFAPGTLRLSCFLKPQHGTAFGEDPSNPLSDALNIVPDFLLAQHAETLAHGALARLFALPNEPFSDPTRSGFFRGLFDQACDRNFASSMTGQQRAPLRTKAQWM